MGEVILVYVQINDGEMEPVSLELLGKAQELAAVGDLRIYAAAAGEAAKQDMQKLSGMKVEKLFYYETSFHNDVNLLADVFVQLCKELKPNIFLIGATQMGRNLAPCIAVQLKTGLTADCTELTIDEDGALIQVRPAFEEKMLASIKTSTRPQMATVRPGIMKQPEQSNEGLPLLEVRRAKRSENRRGYETLSVQTVIRTKGLQIAREKLLIVLGAGLLKQEDTEVFARWAKELGGTIACSRKLVERGWFTVERQIGLSGNASEADLIIAIGVSGSVQFQAGIRKVKHIIAVNNDAKAPIMGIADEGIVMDLNVLIRELRGEGND